MTHEQRVTSALRKLGESRSTLDVRVGVIERKINTVDARLREVHIARDTRRKQHRTISRPHHSTVQGDNGGELTRNERRNVKRWIAHRRIYESALAQLDAMVTNNEAVVMQLQNSHVVTQAVNALSAGAEAGRVHARTLRRLDVDALLDTLAEQQAQLDDAVQSMSDASSTTMMTSIDDDADLERELDTLVREQDAEGTFNSATLAEAHLAAREKVLATDPHEALRVATADVAIRRPLPARSGVGV